MVAWSSGQYTGGLIQPIQNLILQPTSTSSLQFSIQETNQADISIARRARLTWYQ